MILNSFRLLLTGKQPFPSPFCKRSSLCGACAASWPLCRAGGRIVGHTDSEGGWQWVLLLCYYYTTGRGRRRGRKGSKEETTKSGSAQCNDFLYEINTFVGSVSYRSLNLRNQQKKLNVCTIDQSAALIWLHSQSKASMVTKPERKQKGDY